MLSYRTIFRRCFLFYSYRKISTPVHYKGLLQFDLEVIGYPIRWSRQVQNVLSRLKTNTEVAVEVIG